MRFNEAKREVDLALDQGRLCVVVGSCSVRYSGRAASKLSEGDRLVIVKPDGTFLVHQRSKMAAINYQGPGARISSSLEDKLVLSARREKPKEEIQVVFNEVRFAASFDMHDDTKLKVFGSERQLSDLLMQDLHLIEPGLVPLQQESFVKKGAIDILARDKSDALVVIEVKRRTAGLDAVTQLDRYVKELRHRKNVKVRGLLCSPSVTPNAHTMLEKEGLEYFKLDYEVSNPSAKIKGLQKKQRGLADYLGE